MWGRQFVEHRIRRKTGELLQENGDGQLTVVNEPEHTRAKSRAGPRLLGDRLWQDKSGSLRRTVGGGNSLSARGAVSHCPKPNTALQIRRLQTSSFLTALIEVQRIWCVGSGRIPVMDVWGAAAGPAGPSRLALRDARATNPLKPVTTRRAIEKRRRERAKQLRRSIAISPRTILAITGSSPRNPGCETARCNTSTWQAPAVGSHMLGHFWVRRSGSPHRLELRCLEATNTNQDRTNRRTLQPSRSPGLPRRRPRRGRRCLSFACAPPSNAKVPTTRDPSMRAARIRKEPSML
jgi:hypothetical protein